MRVPPFDHYEKWLAGVGLFIVGSIFGSALFMCLYQHNFSLLSIQNQHLRTEIDNLNMTNKNITDKQISDKKASIRTIKVVFEQKNEPKKLDELSENELRKKIVEDLKFLSGKAIVEIKDNPLLFRKLIDGKTYHNILERDYIIYVRSIILMQSELNVVVTADSSFQ